MKKFSKVLVFSILAVFLLGGNATATYIGPGGGTEDSLQKILNDITVGGDSSVDAAGTDNDALLDTLDSYWSITASGGSLATFIIELAGYAGGNSFGVFDTTDTSKTVELFNGGHTVGDQVLMSIKADGSVFLNTGTDTGVDFAGNNFGYYFTSDVGNTFYSDTALNALAGDNYFDHMVAFQGTNTDTIQLPGLSSGLWTDSEFIIAWEDLLGGGDEDFNDMVLMVGSVNSAVPEPATMLLFGTGLLGMAAFGRRKFFKK